MRARDSLAFPIFLPSTHTVDPFQKRANAAREAARSCLSALPGGARAKAGLPVAGFLIVYSF